MAFTQEKRTNIGVCLGCEKHCKYGTVTERQNFVTAGNQTVSYWYIYPTLAGRIIDSYVDRFGEKRHTAIQTVNDMVPATGQKVTDEWRKLFEDQQLQKAFEISQLCDNYKVR